jgi:hypothetical protein
MKRISILVVFIFSLVTGVKGQDEFSYCQVRIVNLFNKLSGNFSDEYKLSVNDSLCILIEEFASSQFVFNRTFNDLKYLGQITSPDSLVKIITWNLILNNGFHRYYCYFINRGESSQTKVFKLAGSGTETRVRTDTTYSRSDWYAALYYDIRPFISGKNLHYLIIGIDYNNQLVTRKIIDVLTFDPTVGPVFGKKCFLNGRDLKYREVFEFTSGAVMTLRFVSDSSVVFSHLSRFDAGMPDLPQFYGPDQSFDSYNFSKGLWRLESDIDIRNKE